MHITVASKILENIKRRGIDKLQDIEEEIMTSKSMSNATKQFFLEFFNKLTDKTDEINDKLRLLLIYIYCSGDLSDIKSIIEVMKNLHKD